MHGFYAGTGLAPLDQADGLRRLFGGGRRRIVPLVANPHVAFTSVVLERATAALGAQAQHVLLVDAADNAPPPHELAPVNLASCVERLSAEVSYLAARGLPRAFVDTRGSAAALLDALVDAAPEAEVLLVHAGASDLARLLGRRPVRPVLLGADAPESIKHAYAGLKLLAQRCGLLTFDLLLAAPPSSRRLAAIADSLARCADGFLGALLQDWAVVDPASDVRDAVAPALARLLSAQLALGEAAVPAAPPAMPARQAFPI
jgi:flagellar biosynthesis protein FlhG